MAELTISTTYGSALFQAASEVGKKELILEEATQVLAIMEQEPDLRAFINTPVLSKNEKKRVLGTIFEGRISDELLHFIYILVDKGRTRHFAKAIKAYKDFLNIEDGVAYGKIYSVTLLSQERLDKFEEQTSKLLQKKVKLENEIDAGLIGGIKILIEGKIIDASIRKRLDDLAGTVMQQ